MNITKTLSFAVAAALVSAGAWAYQVTGPVVEVKDNSIVIEPVKYKGEKWEIMKDASTKMTGTPKVGDKVTIEYKMMATSVEVKPADAKKDTKKK